MMIETTTVTTKSGNEINLISTATGNTGRPEYNKFSEAYEAPEGRKVDARFATTLFLSERDEIGQETVRKLRVVMWGDVAREAAKALGYEGAPEGTPRRTARMRLVAAIEKPYVYEGVEKVSYSVNDYRQIAIEKLQAHTPVITFGTAEVTDPSTMAAPF